MSGNASDQTEGIAADKGSRIMSAAHSVTWPPISQRRVMETMPGAPVIPIADDNIAVNAAGHSLDSAIQVPAGNAADDHAHTDNNGTSNAETAKCCRCNWKSAIFFTFALIFLFIYVTSNLGINLFGRGKDGSVEIEIIIVTNSSGTSNITIRDGPRKTPDINEGQHHVPAPSKSAEMQPFSNMPPSAPEGESPEGTIPSQVGGSISSHLQRSETGSKKAFASRDKLWFIYNAAGETVAVAYSGVLDISPSAHLSDNVVGCVLE